jgi:hypothetical protein
VEPPSDDQVLTNQLSNLGDEGGAVVRLETLWKTKMGNDVRDESVGHDCSPFCGRRNAFDPPCESISKGEKISEFFVFGHMSEVDLPIFTGLAATKLVEGLAEVESALGVCLGADRANLLDPTDGGLEAPRVEQGFQEREKGFGAYV